MDLEDMKKYITTAKANNFKIVWTALLQLDEHELASKTGTIQKYKEILKFSKENDMINIIDVNQRILNAINFDGDFKFFAELNIDVVRFDSPMSPQQLANLTFNDYGIKIELNMDNNDYLLDETLHYGGIKDNILGSHNFYPQKYCGISKAFYQTTSKKFKNLGIETSAFVSTKNPKRIANWDVDDFCCTLEDLRGLNLISQVNYLWSSNLTDNVIICNAYASNKELEALGKLNPYYVNLQVVLQTNISDIEKTIIFDEEHFRRADINPYFIRSTQSRVKYKSKAFPPNQTKQSYEIGDVLIGNDDFSLYKGELQLAIAKSEADARKNLVAQVIVDDLLSLENINSYTKFKFILADEMH
ncbi:hypothetical protein SCLARK_001364 [Spiroplasma clarkii]|nr:hypothetical protein SCLARK_001364 [Spiroplasma clarkii]